MPLPFLAPLLAAFGYTLAALMLKRATGHGAGPWRISFVTNWVMTAVFSLLWLLPVAHPMSAQNFGHASLCGALFFIGQMFTFLALSRGEVSVATPVLGTKVIFVALFTVFIGGLALTPGIWLAVILTAVATSLLGGGGNASPAALWRSLLYGFSAASVFALTDVLQHRWVLLWGFPHFIATMFLTVAVLSLGLIPFFHGSLWEMTGTTWRWTLAGGTTLAVQAVAMSWGIMTLGATTANVLYNSRGIWSVVLVWTIGGWFGNFERDQGRATMLRRLCGSALLLVAIVLITQHA